MTYRTLMIELAKLTDHQLDLEVIVEGGAWGCEADEWELCELGICGPDHATLCDGQPTIIIV